MWILASASPRRRDLLRAAGLEFEIIPAHVDESVLPGEPPRGYVRRVARAKANAVPGFRVLAADTIVVLDGAILGKPADPEAARASLAALSGREHTVHTAVVVRADRRCVTQLCTTRVSFRRLSPHDIDTYLATREPYDKAGGYGIQGPGALLVDRLRGSYTNVMGLPLAETLALVARFKAARFNRAE